MFPVKEDQSQTTDTSLNSPMMKRTHTATTEQDHLFQTQSTESSNHPSIHPCIHPPTHPPTTPSLHKSIHQSTHYSCMHPSIHTTAIIITTTHHSLPSPPTPSSLSTSVDL